MNKQVGLFQGAAAAAQALPHSSAEFAQLHEDAMFCMQAMADREFASYGHGTPGAAAKLPWPRSVVMHCAPAVRAAVQALRHHPHRRALQVAGGALLVDLITRARSEDSRMDVAREVLAASGVKPLAHALAVAAPLPDDARARADAAMQALKEEMLRQQSTAGSGTLTAAHVGSFDVVLSSRPSRFYLVGGSRAVDVKTGDLDRMGNPLSPAAAARGGDGGGLSAQASAASGLGIGTGAGHAHGLHALADVVERARERERRRAAKREARASAAAAAAAAGGAASGDGADNHQAAPPRKHYETALAEGELFVPSSMRVYYHAKQRGGAQGQSEGKPPPHGGGAKGGKKKGAAAAAADSDEQAALQPPGWGAAGEQPSKAEQRTSWRGTETSPIEASCPAEAWIAGAPEHGVCIGRSLLLTLSRASVSPVVVNSD